MSFQIDIVKEILDYSEKNGREVVYIVYEEGGTCLLPLGFNGGIFRTNIRDIKYILHTHTVPRYTPSLTDILTAYRISRIKGTSIPLYTVSRVNNKIIIYEIKVRPDADIDTIIEKLKPIESMIIKDIDMYSKIQHYKMLSRRDISITRYIILE